MSTGRSPSGRAARELGARPWPPTAEADRAAPLSRLPSPPMRSTPLLVEATAIHGYTVHVRFEDGAAADVDLSTSSNTAASSNSCATATTSASFAPTGRRGRSSGRTRPTSRPRPCTRTPNGSLPQPRSCSELPSDNAGSPSNRAAVAATARSAMRMPAWLCRQRRPSSPARRAVSSSRSTSSSWLRRRSAGERSRDPRPLRTSIRVTSEHALRPLT